MKELVKKGIIEAVEGFKNSQIDLLMVRNKQRIVNLTLEKIDQIVSANHIPKTAKVIGKDLVWYTDTLDRDIKDYRVNRALKKSFGSIVFESVRDILLENGYEIIPWEKVQIAYYRRTDLYVFYQDSDWDTLAKYYAMRFSKK